MSSEPEVENTSDIESEENSSNNQLNLTLEKRFQNFTTTSPEDQKISELEKDDKKEPDVDEVMKDINNPMYTDVTPMINSKVPFLIDGDALIMHALLQENHEITLGGQFLHVAYYCERFLQALLDKGANFIIVFFDIWRRYWEKHPYITCLRLSIYTHLTGHTSYRLITYPSFNCEGFLSFLNFTKPRCVLLDLGYHLTVETFNECASLPDKISADENIASFIVCSEILFFRTNDLPCVDIQAIDIGESIISSYHLNVRPLLRGLSLWFYLKLNTIIPPSNSPTDDLQVLRNDYSGMDSRRAIVIVASSSFLSNYSDTNVLKLILLCYASLEVLHLEHRCCPIFEFNIKFLPKVQDIVLEWMRCMSTACFYFLKHETALVWNNIADLWQATMFNYICYIVQNAISTASELGQFQEAYEQYIKLVQLECDTVIDPYPISPICKAENGKLVEKEREETEDVNLYLLNNNLIRKFCGNDFQDAKWLNPPSTLETEEFDEIHHWHCKRPLTDDWDHVKESITWDGSVILRRNMTPDSWKQKQLARHSYYLEVYGNNLEGSAIEPETILCGSKNNGEKKQKKEKKKVAELKQKIKDEKEKNILAKEKEIVKELKNRLEAIRKIQDKLCTINLVLNKLITRDTILSAELMKVKAYRDHIMNVRTVHIDNDMRKDIFLLVRSILERNTVIKDKDQILLSKILHELGLDEIARRNNLPTDVRYTRIVNLNWIRFQLEHLGPEMKRIANGEYDPDIGFTPDPWQKKFIDAVRKKKSALVVAPTSSGKTFAAYYCMKRVLQESEDGVVVYVAPTKALVNQVEATVYARFKNAKLRDGKTVVGVYTRDYKSNTLNSRILITVPQCLDILLLSPRRYTWSKNLKYAIFDEVHKLSGNEEGLVWERCLLLIRCPFLALSATISDVPEFHSWLVSNEKFKGEQDRLYGRERNSYEVVLVEHKERHSDLVKYVYDVNVGLQHYHPYCALDSKTLQEHNGIPPTICLTPHEVLQLYDVMNSFETIRRKFTEKDELFNFFSDVCKSGFINRNDVTEYERIIAKIFYETYEEDEEIVGDIIKQLNSVEVSEETWDSRESVANIPGLMNCIADKKLLPCIVFSYNRDLIEAADLYVIQDCKKNEITETDKKKQKEEDKQAKAEKKMREKEEGANQGQAVARAIKSSSILRSTGSKFKGAGKADSRDMQFIERRLSQTKCDPVLRAGFAYGVAYHHGGLNNRLRSSVEILFRMGIVKVVFATGTLALGIHMPCKSVVVFGDSPFLNSIEFHQMSGRAGRRGFDTQGNVIFMGLTKNRQDMLMTDKLPKMLGNFPISVTLVARILLLVTRVTDKGKSSDEVTNIMMSNVLALLENSLIFKFKPNLKTQIKHFVDFAAQLLFIQGIYSAEGVPLKLASVVNHLHYHEPANLVFSYLFRSGALRELIASFDNQKDTEWALVIVLSHLFARLRLHKIHLTKTFKNSVVILEPLPDIILKAVEKYNAQVKFIFNEYFISVATHLAATLGKDNTLPLSGIKILPLFNYETEDQPGTLSAKIKSACIKRIACSSFVALSGNTDTDLYTGTVISNIRHQICPGIKIVPLLDTDIVHNSYAADFYRHGIVQAIRRDNGLRAGAEFTRIKDFLLVLKTLLICLEELEPVDQDDPIYTYFKSICNTFNQKFKKAFDV